MEKSNVGSADSQDEFLKRQPTSWRWRLPRRYVIALLLLTALFITNWMMFDFTAAVLHIFSTHRYLKEFFPKEYMWSLDELQLIDSAYFWGCAAGQIPGALLAMKYSSHRMLLISMATSSLLHAAMPLALNYHVGVMITMNVVQGIVQGCICPSAMGMFMEWAPPAERARMVTIAYSGLYIGSILGLPIGLYLVEDLGEEIPYFASAIAGLIWCILWVCYAYESPALDPFITEKELNYLEESITPDVKAPITVKQIPVMSLLLSFPLWSICIVRFIYCFIFFVGLVFYAFLLSVTDQDSTSAPVHLPHVILVATTLLSGFISDFLVNRGWCSVAVTRKLFCCGAFVLYSVFTLAIILCKDFHAAVILLHLAVGSLGFSIAGFVVNTLDICRRYTVLAEGISRTFWALSGVIIPHLLDQIEQLHVDSDLESPSWVSFGYAVIAAAIFGAVVFGFGASGDTQSWAKLDPDQAEDQSTYRSAGADYYPSEEMDDTELVDDNSSL